MRTELSVNYYFITHPLLRKIQIKIKNKKYLYIIPVIKIEQNSLERVDSKYLGVWIDTNMRYSNQMDHIRTKLSQLCGISYRLLNHFNKKAALNMYYSCVYAVMTYGIGIWGGAALFTSRGERLTLQNKIVKKMSKYDDGGTSLFKSFKIFKLPDVYRLRACMYMFQILHLNQHASLRRDLNLQYFNHQYNNRGSGELLLPAPRIEVFRMGFKNQFVKV